MVLIGSVGMPIEEVQACRSSSVEKPSLLITGISGIVSHAVPVVAARVPGEGSSSLSLSSSSSLLAWLKRNQPCVCPRVLTNRCSRRWDSIPTWMVPVFLELFSRVRFTKSKYLYYHLLRCFVCSLSQEERKFAMR
jgi:hypothetical protein